MRPEPTAAASLSWSAASISFVRGHDLVPVRVHASSRPAPSHGLAARAVDGLLRMVVARAVGHQLAQGGGGCCHG